jgi:hypothetical protein
MAEIDTQLINTQHSWDMCATCAQHFKTQCSDYYDKFGDKRPDAETAHSYFFSKPEYKCGCFEDDQQIMGFLVTSGRRGFLLRIAQNNHTCITGTYYMYDQPTDQILYKKTIRESTIIMPMSVLRKILIEFEIEHQTKKLSAASATSTPNICKKCIRHFNSFNTIKTHCLDNNFMYKTPKVHLHGKIVYTITFAKIPPIGDTTSMFVPLHTYIITNSEITHYNMHSTTIDNANHDANHDAIFNILTERCKSDKY